MEHPDLTPDLLLSAYTAGLFPMAERRDDPELFWVDPTDRGVLPLHRFHMSRSLRRTLRAERHRATLNADFARVLDHCAAREETWINGTIRDLYSALHLRGQAHSLEIWEGDDLAGGVYGVVLGAAFFGESMFSRRRDGSKIALAWLIDHLLRCGFTLFDTQFVTPHLARLGAIEVPRETYRKLLRHAIRRPADIHAVTLETDVHSVVQRITQTS